MFLIYTRVSTLDQAADDKTSLAEQERVCFGIAMARGIDKMDIDIYSDPGQSGAAPLRFRPEGKKLLAAMRPGDFVCAAKLDRMFRSAGDALQTIEVFREAGVGLILPEMGLEPVTDNGPGKLFFGILSLVADFERTMINDRMKSGKAAKKARGGHIGGEAPYGQRLVGRGRDARLEIEPCEQETVALIVRLRKRGQSLHAVRKRLIKDGHKTRSGKDFQLIQIARVFAYARKVEKEQDEVAKAVA
jgi:putative DNA-invertase from lambdoid prophage Rac